MAISIGALLNMGKLIHPYKERVGGAQLLSIGITTHCTYIFDAFSGRL